MKFVKNILATIMVVCTACCFTACEEETVEQQVAIEIEVYNGEGVYFESASEYEYQNAQYSAISEANGSKVDNIAHTCKDHLKSNFRRIFTSGDIDNLKKHNTYWEIIAKDYESGSIVDKATLKASEL